MIHPATSDGMHGSWELDPTSSSARFRSTSFWGLVKVSGRFTALHGHASVGEDDKLDGELIIDASSVDTGNGKRDAHLRSADFFDVANHPDITFTPGGTVHIESDRVTVRGTLTVAGMSRPLEVPVTLSDMDDAGVTVTASVDVDRSVWGLDFRKNGMTRMSTPIEVVARFTRVR